MADVRELERLRRAVARLMDAQQEALDTLNRALEPSGEDFGDETAQLQEESEHLEAALEDVQAVLAGASEDVRAILDGGDG
jgi:hypothetical protein